MPWTGEVAYLSGQTDFQMLQLPGYKGKEPLDYLQRAEDMQFLEACDYLARKFNVLLDPKPEKKAPKAAKMKNGARRPREKT